MFISKNEKKEYRINITMYTTKKTSFLFALWLILLQLCSQWAKLAFLFFMAGFGGKLLSSLGCLISMYGLRIVWFQTF